MKKIFSHLHNFNTFLLDVTTPIIEYLERPHLDFDSRFRMVCLANGLFDNWCNPYSGQINSEKQKQIFEYTQSFLYSLMAVSEYVGCECHNKSFQEYDAEISRALAEYVLCLLAGWNDQAFKMEMSKAVPEFIQDYASIVAKLDEKKFTIKSAQADLCVWRDAIPDEFLQDALLAMRFAYITKHLKLSL